MTLNILFGILSYFKVKGTKKQVFFRQLCFCFNFLLPFSHPLPNIWKYVVFWLSLLTYENSPDTMYLETR